MTEIKRTQYWFYRARSVCTNCGKEDAFTMAGRSRCFECNKKKLSKQRFKRNNDYVVKEDNIKYCRARYWKLKEAGICTRCGKRKTKYGRSRCELCLGKDRMSYERNKPAGVGYFDETMCRRCKKNPPIDGKKLCENCYNKSLAALNIAMQMRDNSKHIWRTFNDADF